MLDREGEQNWTRESCLRALLVDLSTRGLLEPEEDEETFEPTNKNPESELREYQKEVLNSIEDSDLEELVVDPESFDIDTSSVATDGAYVATNTAASCSSAGAAGAAIVA